MPSRLEQAKELVKDDSVVQKLAAEDPSKNHKYLKWMCLQHLKGHQFGDIVGTVEAFNRRKKSLTHQDIYKYDELKNLEEEILKLKPSKSERKYLKNLKEGVDYITLFDKENISFYAVLSYKGIRNLGDKTRWCVAAQKSYWDSYSSYGDFYVLINSEREDSFSKIAFHDQEDYYCHYYDANDCQIDWAAEASYAVQNEVGKHKNLISQIRGKKSKNSKNPRVSFINEKGTDKQNSDLIKFVKSKNLWGLIRLSHKKDLIEAIKEDYLKHVPELIFDKTNSSAFNQVFANEFDTSSIIKGLQNVNIKNKDFAPFKNVLYTLSDKEYADLLNNCSYQSVRLNLLKNRPKIWKKVNKDKIGVTVAAWMLKTHGVNALDKAIHMAKNQSTYWNRATPNAALKELTKLDIKPDKATELLKRKDLSTPVKKYLNKKIKKKKKLSPEEKDALKLSLEDLVNDGVIDKESLTAPEVNKLLKEINL